jgi:hypothetical protein
MSERELSLYRRTLKEVVFLRHYSGAGAARVPFNTLAHARVTGYMPNEIVSGGAVQQGDRKVILLAEDLVAAGTLPPVKGDMIVVRGRELNIQSVDDNTRRDGAELIAYVIQARG